MWALDEEYVYSKSVMLNCTHLVFPSQVFVLGMDLLMVERVCLKCLPPTAMIHMSFSPSFSTTTVLDRSIPMLDSCLGIGGRHSR
jgi:hypothetical protein